MSDNSRHRPAICRDAAVCYIARRHGLSPDRLIEQYRAQMAHRASPLLEANELEIIRELERQCPPDGAAE